MLHLIYVKFLILSNDSEPILVYIFFYQFGFIYYKS